MLTVVQGHTKVVKYLVDHVTQFPSDADLTRYINTLSDKVLPLSLSLSLLLSPSLLPSSLSLFLSSLSLSLFLSFLTIHYITLHYITIHQYTLIRCLPPPLSSSFFSCFPLSPILSPPSLPCLPPLSLSFSTPHTYMYIYSVLCTGVVEEVSTVYGGGHSC